MDRKVGVHSEVGKLRTVVVCRPSLAHQRPTRGNCHDLLFDDVIWFQEARKDHYALVLKMRQRGVEVLELHDLLEQTTCDPYGFSIVKLPPTALDTSWRMHSRKRMKSLGGISPW